MEQPSSGGSGGGGGAGGLINSNALFTANTYTIKIGDGGDYEALSRYSFFKKNGFAIQPTEL